MTLKEAIAKRKRLEADEAVPLEIRDFITRTFNDLAISLQVMESQAMEDIRAYLHSVKRGEKGDKGNTPVVGIDFQQPKDGYTPVKGKDYFDGEDGKTPIAGVDFPLPQDGKTPVKGVDYFDGKDGSPDTPAQIAEKLNTLKEAVDFSVIKGLEPRLAAIIRSVKEKIIQKGGGMANVYHETFSISAGTSSITTAHPIGAGGNAIFKCAYQGQELDKDVHFTVGANGRTITFDSAVRVLFQDNTTVSITYIRG